MRRSKHQAVYKYLPGVWTSYKGDEKKLDGNSITIKIDKWNFRDVSNIFTDMLTGQILRSIRLFKARGGNVSSFISTGGNNDLRYVSSARIEDIADIYGSISPLVFYCSSCGKTVSYSEEKYFNEKGWICPKCKRKDMKQLQMVYSCKCGAAYPMTLPYKKFQEKQLNFYINLLVEEITLNLYIIKMVSY